jgi:hypothetical protein
MANNARGTCAAVADAQMKGDMVKSATDLVKSINPLNWLSAQNENQQSSFNVTNKTMSTKDVTDIINECQNKTVGEQLNVIKGSPECVRMWLDACSRIKDENLYNQCYQKAIEASTIRNVKQKNKLQVDNKCIVNTMINKLSEKEASVENVAKMLSLAEADGPAKNSSITRNCNEVNTDISSDVYLRSVSKCINDTALSQKNILEACGPAIDIDQQNEAAAFNQCLIDANIVTVTSDKTVDTNVMEATSKQKATFPIVGMLLAILGIMVVGLIIYLVIKFGGGLKGATTVAETAGDYVDELEGGFQTTTDL